MNPDVRNTGSFCNIAFHPQYQLHLKPLPESEWLPAGQREHSLCPELIAHGGGGDAVC